MVIATVFVFFTVAFVGLSYFAFNLQGQISTLSMHLEPGRDYNQYDCGGTVLVSTKILLDSFEIL